MFRVSVFWLTVRCRWYVRQVKGLLNRLSELNIEPILIDFKKLFTQNSRKGLSLIFQLVFSSACLVHPLTGWCVLLSEVTEALTQCLLAAISDSKQVLSSLIVSTAALISALHVQIGQSVGMSQVEAVF